MASEQYLRVIVYEADGALIAQCLEYDICAHAQDEETLLDRFEAVLNFERNLSIERFGAPFAGISPAPKEFEKMWAECRAGGPPVTTEAVHIELKRCA